MSSTAPVTTAPDSAGDSQERPDLSRRIADLEELAAFLADLAITRPDHIEMLYRLADRARAEAARLRNPSAI